MFSSGGVNQMKEVILNMNENEKYRTIKELVDHNGNKDRAARKLGITRRQVDRLINVYKKKGKAGFIHGNRNRQPANSLSQELSDNIVTLYSEEYQGWNFKHFHDKLVEDEKINVSYASVYGILTKAGFDSPKIQRRTRRKKAKAAKPAEKKLAVVPGSEEIINKEVPIEISHPRKERSKYFGERVEMDASIHDWFGGFKTALHLAVDHASGNVLAAWFEKQETLKGYYQLLWMILTTYGIPMMFFTDNRTVFNYNRSNIKKDSNDVLTQFGYACKQLGIEIRTSSVSQAKGLVERDNGTFQDRLVNELKKEKITTIEAANDYLVNVFVPDFNKRFGRDIRRFTSVMEQAPSREKINVILSVLSSRVFDNGSAIKYDNRYYQAHDENDRLVCFKPKQECLVAKAFDGNLYVTVGGLVYKLVELKRNASTSPEVDPDARKPEKKKHYIPPMNHPWRVQQFKKHRDDAHQFQSYGL